MVNCDSSPHLRPLELQKAANFRFLTRLCWISNWYGHFFGKLGPRHHSTTFLEIIWTNLTSSKTGKKAKRGVVEPAVALGGIKCNIFGPNLCAACKLFCPWKICNSFCCLLRSLFYLVQYFFAFRNFSFASCNHFLPFAALPNIVQLVARCCFKDQQSSRASRNLFTFESIKPKLITRHWYRYIDSKVWLLSQLGNLNSSNVPTCFWLMRQRMVPVAAKHYIWRWGSFAECKHFEQRLKLVKC